MPCAKQCGDADVPPDCLRRIADPCVQPETIFLATDRTTCLRRVQDRQGDHSDDYVIPEDPAAQYIDHFEVPTPDEGPLTVIR